jgi:hypothetical protein
MATGMPNLKEPDEGKRRAEHFLQYVVVDAQGPFPASVRGNCYWVAVVDVHTKLKMSFPAPTLKAAIEFLDHVLKRECNPTNFQVQAVFKSADQARKLDLSADHSDPVLSQAGKELDSFLSSFEGMAGTYQPFSELKARRVCVDILRMDGAPNQRGKEMNGIAAGLGASVEYPVPHGHKSMGGVEGLHSGDLKSGMAALHDANAPNQLWCFFFENTHDSDNYVPRRGVKLSPYALAHSHEEYKPNALTNRCKRAGTLAFCHISGETRTKMGLRGCASIMLCDATFSSYAGYWSLAIDTGVLFVCDSFTVLETELPFRDPRVWKSLGMQYGDNMAPLKPIFDVQLVAKHSPGYTNKLIQPLTLNHDLQPMLSQKFGLNAADEGLTAEQEEKVMATGWRHRSATGHTKPDFSGQPLVETKPEAEPQLPPLNFDESAGANAAAQRDYSVAEMLFEVDTVYAPASTPRP